MKLPPLYFPPLYFLLLFVSSQTSKLVFVYDLPIWLLVILEQWMSRMSRTHSSSPFPSLTSLLNSWETYMKGRIMTKNLSYKMYKIYSYLFVLVVSLSSLSFNLCLPLFNYLCIPLPSHSLLDGVHWNFIKPLMYRNPMSFFFKVIIWNYISRKKQESPYIIIKILKMYKVLTSLCIYIIPITVGRKRIISECLYLPFCYLFRIVQLNLNFYSHDWGTQII